MISNHANFFGSLNQWRDTISHNIIINQPIIEPEKLSSNRNLSLLENRMYHEIAVYLTHITHIADLYNDP